MWFLEFVLWGHDEGDDLLSSGVFRGPTSFYAELYIILKDHLTNATLIKETSKESQNDLMDSMLTVCQSHIENDIAKANFISVTANNDVSSTSQLILAF